MASDDFYSFLGVSSDATTDQIKEAYHTLARKHHPDRHVAEDAEGLEKDVDFVAITKAYNVLKDREKRKKYDEEQESRKRNAPATARPKNDQDKVQQGREEIAKTAFSRGMSEMKQGHFQSARECFLTAVKLDSGQADYYSMLGLATIESGGGFSLAEVNCEKAIALSPWNPAYHLNLAKVYLKANIRTQARKRLEEALRWDANNKEVQQLLDGLDKSEKPSFWKKLMGR